MHSGVEENMKPNLSLEEENEKPKLNNAVPYYKWLTSLAAPPRKYEIMGVSWLA